MKLFTPLACLSLAFSSAHAATIIVSDTVTSSIPDGSSSGLARQLTLNASAQSIVDLEIDLSISAVSGDVAFLGDLYIYLSHGSELAVLVNRPGRLIGSPSGYSDNQSMSVTFSEGATNDIHNYRFTLNSSHATPLTSALTGTWQADGRATDPATVLDTDARTAVLSVFTGTAASGDWNLFAADLSTGAVHQVTGWTIRMTTVPEPSSALLLSLSLAAALRRKRTS